MGELLRIRQDVDRSDAAVAGVQRQDRVRLRVQVADDPRLPIDSRDPRQQIPWDELFKLLKKADYQGWTLLEEGPIPKDIVAAIKENREIWDKLTK